MNAVGKLGSYISRSVYIVSGPFHPFGGAIDIIVVEQPDGSFKSSPWNVRFGKFQGVLKAREKIVRISVNGVDTDFRMYLDHKGEAYFLREVDVEGLDISLSPWSSGDDTDRQSDSGTLMKLKSCNNEAHEGDSVIEIGASVEKTLSSTSSHQSRILGHVFGGKSAKEDGLLEENNDSGVVRSESLERAEIAADLLELKWSTDLVSSRHKKNSISRLSQDISDGNDINKLITDIQNTVDSHTHGTTHDTMAESSKDCSPLLKIDSTDNKKGHSSLSILTDSKESVEEIGKGNLFLASKCEAVTSIVEADSAIAIKESIENENLRVHDTDSNRNMMDAIPEISYVDSQNHKLVNFEVCPLDRCQKDSDSGEKIYGVPDSGFLVDGNKVDCVPTVVYSETSTTSRHELGTTEKQSTRTDFCSGELCEHSFCETLQTEDLVCEDGGKLKIGSHVEESLCTQEFVEKTKYSVISHVAKIPECAGVPSDSADYGFLSRTCWQMPIFQPLLGSVEDMASESIVTISQPRVEKDTSKDGKIEFALHHDSPSLVLSGDTIGSNVLKSRSSEEEQILFGDIDNFREIETRPTEDPIYGDHSRDTDTETRVSQIKTEVSMIRPAQIKTEVNDFSMPNHVCGSSLEMSTWKDLPVSAKKLGRKLKSISSVVNISASSGSQSEEIRIARSLPNMWIPYSDFDVYDFGHFTEHSSKDAFLKKDVLNSVETNDVNYQRPSKSLLLTEDASTNNELRNGSAHLIVGNSSRPDASSGNWRIWPFSFSRSRSTEGSESALRFIGSSGAQDFSERGNAAEDERDMPKLKITKKEVRVKTPTSEQLASLNLKEGRNIVTFTFSTPMLGKQQVDAQIHLWKWDAHIVVSDVDGTITRSDLLGQVMPFVGVDWSQTGVANLFSAIKGNGYHVLFLSARAISQAYRTRQFLFNLKQDGKALPEGPVVISPDGLFPSLYREVVRRAPHEFKISCLEAIKALFPADRNPFYAGFGNRDTDEISYLKVGIPKGKIFIINPKGEVAVSRRVDRKSYTSLHALVNDIFPFMSSSEQEDYNSWNYWKLPPPAIDI